MRGVADPEETNEASALSDPLGLLIAGAGRRAAEGRRPAAANSIFTQLFKLKANRYLF